MQAGTNPTRRLLFNALGLAISVIPVTVAIFSYFPLWISRKDASLLSGISLLLITLAVIPLFKYFKQLLHSPSAPVLWFCTFIIFLLLSRIADEMTVISFVGFFTNFLGSLCFKIAKRYSEEERENEGRT